MSARNGFVLLVALSALMFLGACGNGGNGSVTNGSAPPSGGFTGGALNGTYVFSTAGYNVDDYFMVMTGAFTANGKEGITGGAIDIVTGDPAIGVLPNQTIGSSSTYAIGQDGRGEVNLTTGTALGTVTLDFVMSSNAHGLVTEYDGNGNGSGTVDLQSSSISQSQFAGAYTFAISGTGLGLGAASFSTIGDMTLNASGNVSAGLQDFNNGGGATADQALSTSSTVTVGAGTAPGTASLVTALGTYAFDVYAIDSTHLKFVETDSQLALVGDAFTQATTLPTSASLAFTMSGEDSSDNPVGIGGLMPLDASSNVTTGGAEDFNDGGVVGTDSSFAGGFSPISGGRSVLTLSGFVNSATNQVAGAYTFAAYPFTSNGVTGIQLLEIDNAGITSGAAYTQTGTSLATSQGYGLNLSAFDLGNGTGAFYEDDIAEFSTTSSGLSGKIDYDDSGQLTPGQGLSGSYAAGGPAGRYTVTTTNAPNFNLYAVNGSTFLLLETDTDQIGTGVVELQNASGSVSSEPGIAMHRSTAGSHPLLKRR